MNQAWVRNKGIFRQAQPWNIYFLDIVSQEVISQMKRTPPKKKTTKTSL